MFGFKTVKQLKLKYLLLLNIFVLQSYFKRKHFKHYTFYNKEEFNPLNLFLIQKKCFHCIINGLYSYSRHFRDEIHFLSLRSSEISVVFALIANDDNDDDVPLERRYCDDRGRQW